jgi:hypothetical protein
VLGGSVPLRRVLIRDHVDRDAIAPRLIRYRKPGVNLLTMYPDARRQVVRLLSEIDADSA